MDIAVLGGGVGGLSSAIFLKQLGHKVTVYERHSELKNIGAGIVCWPNACFVLDQLDVLQDVRRAAGKMTAMRRFTNCGEMHGSINISQLEDLMGYPSLSILRHDLMNSLLRRATELNLDIQFNHNVSELIAAADHHVEIVFDNGKSRVPDLIIGAEGRMNSLARKYVHGENSPIFQNFINWIGVVEHDGLAFNEMAVNDYWGVGQRFGIVPVNKHKAYWAGGVVANQKKTLNPIEYKQELLDLFADWPNPIADVVNLTDDARINKIYVHDHDPIPRWHKNNVVLLGDAAHAPLPTSGQGACQALEDAWQLKVALESTWDSLSSALQAYTDARQPKTTAITMAGRQLASTIFNDDPEFCSERDKQSKKTNFKGLVKGMANMWSNGLPIGQS